MFQELLYLGSLHLCRLCFNIFRIIDSFDHKIYISKLNIIMLHSVNKSISVTRIWIYCYLIRFSVSLHGNLESYTVR